MNYELLMRKKTLLLLLLFLLAFAVRIFRAYQQPIVNPDAIRFIDQAQLLETDPLRAIREEPYHPLMSALTSTIHPLISLFTANDRFAWLISLQTIGILCGSLLALQIFHLSRALGASFWPSLAAGFAWAVNQRVSTYGPDGLSDMLFLFLFAAAILTAISASRRRKKFPALRFLAIGLLSGLAYLTRPEGLAAPLLLLATILLGILLPTPKFRPLIKTRPLLAILCILAGTLLIALPYILAIGNLTQKTAILVAPAIAQPAQSFLHATAILLTRITVTFGCGPCIVLGVAIFFAPRPWFRRRLRTLVTFWIALWLIVMYALFLRTGYLDGRHTLILQLLLHTLLGLALTIWWQAIRWWMIFRHPSRVKSLLTTSQAIHIPHIFVVVIFLAAVIPEICLWSKAPRADQLYLRQAANWLQINTPLSLPVYNNDLLVGYYANHPYLRLRQFTGMQPAILVRSNEDTYMLPPPTAQLLAAFPSETDTLLLFLYIPPRANPRP